MLSALLKETGIVNVVRCAEASARADFQLYVKDHYDDLMVERAMRLSLHYPSHSPDDPSSSSGSQVPRPGVNSAIALPLPENR